MLQCKIVSVVFPFIVCLSPCFRHKLVLHPTQDVPRGLRHEYDGSDNGSWNILQDAPHGTRYTKLIVFSGSSFVQVPGSITNTLMTKKG